MGHAPHDADAAPRPCCAASGRLKNHPPPPKALFGCIQIHPNPHGLGGIEVEFVRRQKSPNKRQQLP